MEFRMTTDLSVMQPKELSFNFEELHRAISEKTEKYRNLMVTEDGIAEAKKDRANLRKLADALNSEKIAIKKAFMKPYDEFEGKVKELIGLCKVPAEQIDVQIKAFEDAKRAEKRAELESHFLSVIEDAKEYVSFDDIFDPKWLNATVLIDTAKTFIDEICARYNEDVGVLNGLCEEVDVSSAYALKRAFKATRSLANVMRVKNEIDHELKLMAERKANEEARKRAEEERAQKEAEEQAMVERVQKFQNAVTAENVVPASDNIQQPEEVEVCFRVRCTAEQLGKLKAFLRDNNIWYGKV